jgi:hypothetical protein
MKVREFRPTLVSVVPAAPLAGEPSLHIPSEPACGRPSTRVVTSVSGSV